MAGRGFAMPGMAAPGGRPLRPGSPSGNAPASAGGPPARPLPGFGMFTPKAGAAEDPHVQASTELFNGCFENNTAQVKKAVEEGGDVNVVDLKGVTPLVLAVHNNNVDLVKFLLSKKANPNATSTNSSPLHEAVRQRNQQILDILLSAGGNINLQTDFGKTPLHVAIQEEQLAIVDFLLSKRADLKIKNDAQVGCLHFAAAGNDLKVLEKLLSTNALPVSERNGNGKTPLHIAAEKNNLDAIKILLNHGADTKVKDGWGRLPEECGKMSAYRLIKEHQPGQKYEIYDPDAPEEKSKKNEKLFDTD